MDAITKTVLTAYFALAIVSVILISSNPAVNINQENLVGEATSTLSGHYNIIIEDYEEEEKEIAIIADGKQIYQVDQIDEDLVGSTVQYKIDSRARNKASITKVLASNERETPDKMHYLIVPVVYANDIGPPRTREQIRNWMLGGGETVENYFKISSNNQLDIDATVADPVALPFQRPLQLDYCYEHYYDVIERIPTTYDMSDYDGIGVYFPRIDDCPAGSALFHPFPLEIHGKIYLLHRFNIFDIPNDAIFNRNTIAHEIGHNLGMSHFSQFSCQDGNFLDSPQCSKFEYGGRADIMGNSQRGGIINYPQANKLGWNRGPTKTIEENNRASTTHRVYSHASGRYPQALEINRGGDKFYVTYHSEQDYPLAKHEDLKRNEASIIVLDNYNSLSLRNIRPIEALPVGMRIPLQRHGITIEAKEYTDNYGLIEIKFGPAVPLADLKIVDMPRFIDVGVVDGEHTRIPVTIKNVGEGTAYATEISARKIVDGDIHSMNFPGPLAPGETSTGELVISSYLLDCSNLDDQLIELTVNHPIYWSTFETQIDNNDEEFTARFYCAG